MKIGVDVMGGDHAPNAVISGAILALKDLQKEDKIVLYGKESEILELLKKDSIDSTLFDIVHTTEVIEMSEHPAKAFQSKQDSSITVGFKDLAGGKIDSFASAGNTGAMLVGSMFTQKKIDGIERPCIPGYIGQYNGRINIVVDAGLNADCKKEMLYQFAVLGSNYMKYAYNVENPRVALISNGEEREKGNILTLETHEMLIDNTHNLNFVGNIEGNKIYSDVADVMVCSGFTGNIIIKQMEAMCHLAQSQKVKSEFFDIFNYELYGGVPVLGIKSSVIIGHGHSSPLAIKNMIMQGINVAKSEFYNKFTL